MSCLYRDHHCCITCAAIWRYCSTGGEEGGSSDRCLQYCGLSGRVAEVDPVFACYVWMDLWISSVDFPRDVAFMGGIHEPDAAAAEASPTEAGTIDAWAGVQNLIDGDQVLAATLIVIDRAGPGSTN